MKRLCASGHALKMTWSGEFGQESSSTGYCKCGWTESASSQVVVREEYRCHLLRVLENRSNGAPDPDYSEDKRWSNSPWEEEANESSSS